MSSFKKIATFCALAVCVPVSLFAATPPLCNEQTQVCNVEVLVEENANSLSFAQLQHAIAITPDLQQLHLRVSGPGVAPPYNADMPSVANMTGLLKQLRSVAPNLQLGFHPDNNSKDSYAAWGCGNNDYACVFSNSIAYMNAINAGLPAGQGFNIFSIEQSYVEEALMIQGNSAFPQEKQCLQGQIVSGVCTVAANPAVAYANVVGNPYAADLLNAQNFDYAYPQMYNLYKDNWTPGAAQVIDSSLFPAVVSKKYTLLDAYNGSTSFTYPFVPAQLKTDSSQCSILSIYQNGVFGNISLSQHATYAAQVLSSLITSRFPPSIPGYPEASPYPFGVANNSQGQSMEYFTLSGESLSTSGNCFLGSSGWDIPTLNAFFDNYRADLIKLGVSQADASSAPFAIWSFDTMPIYNSDSGVAGQSNAVAGSSAASGAGSATTNNQDLVTFHEF